MKKHKIILGALLLLITAPIFLTILQMIADDSGYGQVWSMRRLSVIGRTLSYGISVSLLVTFIGFWLGQGLALRYKQSRIISGTILCFMGVPPFMVAYFAMDFAKILLNMPFISGFFISLLVSVIYWLPLSISLWMVFVIAIPKAMYDEPILAISAPKAIGKLGYLLFKVPSRIIFLLILLLAMNDYTIPSIFAYNTYPIEIMTVFSSHSDIFTPVIVSLPMILLSIVMMLALVRAWQQMDLDVSQKHHPYLRKNPSGQVIGLIFIVIYILVPFGLLVVRLKGGMASFYMSRSFVSDIGFSYSSAMVAALLTTAVAYYFVYLSLKYSDLRRVLLVMVIVLMSLPGTVVGLMVNVAYQWLDALLGLQLYQTMVPMVHVLMIRFMTISFILLWFGMSQLDRDHLDLARMHASSSLKILYIILWPLTKTYIVISVLVVMMFSLGELAGAIMVTPPGKSTLAITIYNYLHYGSGEVVSLLIGGMFVSYLIILSSIGLVLYPKKKVRN